MQIALAVLILAIVITGTVQVWLARSFLQWLAHVIRLGREK